MQYNVIEDQYSLPTLNFHTTYLSIVICPTIHYQYLKNILKIDFVWKKKYFKKHEFLKNSKRVN